MSRRPLSLSALLIAAVLALPATAQAAGPLGTLSDLPGSAGCVTPDGSSDLGASTCVADAKLSGTTNFDSVVVAPDGRFVYAADEGGLVVLYARDATTGGLSLPGGTRCWTADGSGGCGDYRGSIAGDGNALALSADGRFLYATDQSTDPGLLVFSRDPATGLLTQLAGTAGCLTKTGAGEAGPGTCIDIRGASSPNAVSLSADQRFVYLTDFGLGSILTFARDGTTGALTQLPGGQGCISKDGASEDGTGTCQDARLVADDRGIAITPDGRHAFAADFTRNGVEVFDRDPQTGVLSVRGDQASCATQDGNIGVNINVCLNGRGLIRTYQVAVAADGRTIYVTGEQATSGGIAVLRFDPQTGARSQPAGADGCITATGADGDAGTTCAASDALGSGYGIVTGPDGRTLFSLNRNKGLDAFSIEPATGLVTPLPGTARCLSADGAGATDPGKCTDLKALQTAYSMAFAPEGGTAYVADSARPSVTGLRFEARPVCSPVSATTAFQTPVALVLPCRDPNGDPITRQITSPPANLTLGPLGADGAVTASPAASFSGDASFGYTATDGSGTSDPATATVTVGARIVAASGGGDRAKPKVKLGKLRITKTGIRLTVTLSEPATVTATLRRPAKRGRRAATLARGSRKATKAGALTLTLKATKAGRSVKRLKGRRLKAFRAALTLTATDLAGNRATVTSRKARLTR